MMLKKKEALPQNKSLSGVFMGANNSKSWNDGRWVGASFPPGRPPTFRFLWVEHSINLKEKQQSPFILEVYKNTGFRPEVSVSSEAE